MRTISALLSQTNPHLVPTHQDQMLAANAAPDLAELAVALAQQAQHSVSHGEGYFEDDDEDELDEEAYTSEGDGYTALSGDSGAQTPEDDGAETLRAVRAVVTAAALAGEDEESFPIPLRTRTGKRIVTGVKRKR